MIVGLDTASSRWHAVEIVGPGEVRVASSGPLEGAAWADPDRRRLVLVREFALLMEEVRASDAVMHLYCEEPLALQNGKTTRLLCMAAGALWAAWAAAAPEGWTWCFVDVAHWKRRVIGKGNATKDDIRAWALADGCPDLKQQDFFDAYAICRYGIEHRASLGESPA